MTDHRAGGLGGGEATDPPLLRNEGRGWRCVCVLSDAQESCFVLVVKLALRVALFETWMGERWRGSFGFVLEGLCDQGFWSLKVVRIRRISEELCVSVRIMAFIVVKMFGYIWACFFFPQENISQLK